MVTNISDPYNICRACNFAKNDCCHTPHPIFVGVLEAIKIHQETGMKYSEFLTYTEFDEDQFHEAFEELVPRKTIALIMYPPDRRCVFFTENGCRIPQWKPFICRVFPLWYEQEIYKEDGTIQLFLEERLCLLRDKILSFTSMDEGCRFMGTSEQEIAQIFRNAFEHFKRAREFEYLFETISIDAAFAEIEKQLKRNRE
jgi:Fe-S-cluster containining protein